MARLLACAVRKGVSMTLSDYELRVLREMEAEFAKPPLRLRRWCGRRAVGLLLASVVLVVVLAVSVSVAVAATVAVGCALLAVAAVIRTRRRARAQDGR
jgi:hypothetical protein